MIGSSNQAAIMRVLPLIFITLIWVPCFGATITHPNLPNALPKNVDALDFFVPSGSAVGWIIGGNQTGPLPAPWGTKDPEGTKLKAFAMNKFNSPQDFEIYKVDGRNIYIRYECLSNWIRGFDTRGDKRGEVFLVRKVPTSGSRIVHQNFSTHVFQLAKKKWYLSESHPVFAEFSEYKILPAANSNDILAVRPWLHSCNCGLDNIDILLHLSYWQSQGKIVEFYSYGFGVGFVHWRWTENLTLNNGAAVQKKPDGSGVYTCYLLGHQLTIKNWAAVLASPTKSVEPEAYYSLHSPNDTRVYVTKLKNPNINQTDWYATCQDNDWNPLTARQATIGIDLSENKTLPLPKGVAGLPLEYPSNLRADSTFNKDDNAPHKIEWDSAAIISTPRQGLKHVQTYQVVLKQGSKVQGTYVVSAGATSFTVPADYPRGKYKAFVSAQEGNRQNIAARLSFTIH